VAATIPAATALITPPYAGLVETSPHLLRVAELNGAGQRHGGWDPPTGDARAAALEELRSIGGDDTEAYAHAAGTMLGGHPPGIHHNAAMLILEAARLTLDDDRVKHWIAVGEKRREKTLEAMRAGDHWGPPG
jgi:hypothetical protein